MLALALFAGGVGFAAAQTAAADKPMAADKGAASPSTPTKASGSEVVGKEDVHSQDMAGDDQPKPTRQSWSFNGPFGKFDQAQLQRGFQVYREVCSNCHRLSASRSARWRTPTVPASPWIR